MCSLEADGSLLVASLSWACVKPTPNNSSQQAAFLMERIIIPLNAEGNGVAYRRLSRLASSEKL